MSPALPPVVFDRTCRRAYVATLRGTVRAVAHLDNLGGELLTLWTASAGAPVISAPAFLAAQRALAVATVQGSVRCFSNMKGRLLPCVICPRAFQM